MPANARPDILHNRQLTTSWVPKDVLQSEDEAIPFHLISRRFIPHFLIHNSFLAHFWPWFTNTSVQQKEVCVSGPLLNLHWFQSILSVTSKDEKTHYSALKGQHQRLAQVITAIYNWILLITEDNLLIVTVNAWTSTTIYVCVPGGKMYCSKFHILHCKKNLLILPFFFYRFSPM